MNPAEQANHKRRTDAIVSDVVAIAEATADRLDTLEQRISDERTARLALSHEQRGYVDNEDRQLRQCCQERWISINHSVKLQHDRQRAFEDRGFWSRLNWLITGR